MLGMRFGKYIYSVKIIIEVSINRTKKSANVESIYLSLVILFEKIIPIEIKNEMAIYNIFFSLIIQLKKKKVIEISIIIQMMNAHH